jgi:hypothetical protein
VLFRYRSSSFERHKQNERFQLGGGKGDEPDAPPEDGRALQSPVESAEPPAKKAMGGGGGDVW